MPAGLYQGILRGACAEKILAVSDLPKSPCRVPFSFPHPQLGSLSFSSLIVLMVRPVRLGPIRTTLIHDWRGACVVYDIPPVAAGVKAVKRGGIISSTILESSDTTY